MNEVKTPNFELLKDAYAIIDGIPEDRFNLNVVTRTDAEGHEKDPHYCGTVGCALGWLAMHPQFQALGLGLYVSDHRSQQAFTSFFGANLDFEKAGAMVFGMTVNDATAMFRPARHVELFPNREESLIPVVSDKQVWQNRVKTYLRAHGQL